jgi:hypothetical protein
MERPDGIPEVIIGRLGGLIACEGAGGEAIGFSTGVIAEGNLLSTATLDGGGDATVA